MAGKNKPITDGTMQSTDGVMTGVVSISAESLHSSTNIVADGNIISGSNIKADSGTLNSMYLRVYGDVLLGVNDDAVVSIGQGNETEIGFYGAVPVKKPTTTIAADSFDSGSSGIIDDSAKYGDYTVGQIVSALKSLGFLK